MNYLRKNSILFLLIGFTVWGCSSSSYKIANEDEGRTEIMVTPDRVLLECEHISDYSGNAKNVHGFMIHVLDENKTVFTVNQGNLIGKEDCYERLNKIGKILKTGNKIFIGGMGNLHNPHEPPDQYYTFPGLGTFPFNGRVLQYMVIWNDKGLCFNAYSGERKPCPADEFPIEK